MRFFDTQLALGSVLPLADGALFLTSEQPPFGPRAYSVRRAYDNGRIETVGDFCSYETRQAAEVALQAARSIAVADEL